MIDLFEFFLAACRLRPIPTDARWELAGVRETRTDQEYRDYMWRCRAKEKGYKRKRSRKERWPEKAAVVGFKIARGGE